MMDRADKPPDRELPSEPTFRRILRKHCPLVTIRSPRNSVCDDCAMY